MNCQPPQWWSFAGTFGIPEPRADRSLTAQSRLEGLQYFQRHWFAPYAGLGGRLLSRGFRLPSQATHALSHRLHTQRYVTASITTVVTSGRHRSLILVIGIRRFPAQVSLVAAI